MPEPNLSESADGEMLSKNRVMQRAGWGKGRVTRDLDPPDEVRETPSGVTKLYSLRRVEAAEAKWSEPPPKPERPRNQKSSKKRRKPKRGMAPELEDALTDSMISQLKDGISDDELMNTTYTQAELLRRGWTATLIRDLLGSPHWLLPNPKYPNAGAPMKLWDKAHIKELERTSEWIKRRSQRAGAPVVVPVGDPLPAVEVR